MGFVWEYWGPGDCCYLLLDNDDDDVETCALLLLALVYIDREFGAIIEPSPVGHAMPRAGNISTQG